MVNGDDQFRFRIGDLVGEFLDGVNGISGGDDGANGGNGEEGNREEDGVGGEDENDVVFGDVVGVVEGVGEIGDFLFEVGESDDLMGMRVD